MSLTPPQPVILDTNVFVGAGFNPNSASAALTGAARDGALRLIWHETTLSETRRILRRIPPIRFDDVAALFTPQGEYEGMLDLEAAAVVPDPEDRKFAALAMASSAPLVSSDSDLLDVRDRLAAIILTPTEAIRHFGLTR